MKKTILKIVTIAILVAMMFIGTSVNAASLTADKTEMKKGDIVTVTVKTKEPVASMQFDLKFDTNKYEYVENSVKTKLSVPGASVNGNILTVSAFDLADNTTDTLTVQFRAKENGASIPFTISGTEFIKSDDSELKDSFDKATINVTIADKKTDTKPGTETTKPGTDASKPGVDTSKPGTDANKPSTDTNKPSADASKPGVDANKPSTDTNNKNDETNQDKNIEEKTNSTVKGVYIDEDGNKIEKIPQTGDIMPSILLGVALFVIAIIAGYKIIKNIKNN